MFFDISNGLTRIVLLIYKTELARGSGGLMIFGEKHLISPAIYFKIKVKNIERFSLPGPDVPYEQYKPCSATLCYALKGELQSK